MVVPNASSRSNISKTSESASSGYPNTEKQMKVQGRRPRAFIVSRYLDTLVKHEAQIFEMTSQSCIIINKRYFYVRHSDFVVVCLIIT